MKSDIANPEESNTKLWNVQIPDDDSHNSLHDGNASTTGNSNPSIKASNKSTVRCSNTEPTHLQCYFTFQLKFFQLYIPFLFLQGLENFSYILTTYFASQIDGNHMAGVGLGCTASNVILVSAMYGYSSVFETYGPQIYASNTQKALGTLLLKCLLQGLLVFLVVIGPFVNVTHLLTALEHSYGSGTGQHSVHEIAKTFILYTAGFGYVDFCVDTLNKYLMTQERQRVVYVTSTAYIVMYILANYLLVTVLGYGVAGLAVAMYLARGGNLLLQVAYCAYSNRHRNLAWTGFCHHVFLGWGEMLKLGTSGILTMLADVGVVEVATFMTQFAGTTNLSVVVINLQSYILVIASIFAHAYATTMAIGNALGSQNKHQSHEVLKVALSNIVFISLPMALVMWGLRYPVARIFSDDEVVVEAYAEAVWISAIFLPIDYLGSVIARGVLVAFGKQRFSAGVSSICSYLIGIPLVCIVVFKTEFGARGIFGVFVIFGILKLSASLIRLLMIDMRTELQKSLERVKEFESSSRRITDVDIPESDMALGTMSTLFQINTMSATDDDIREGVAARLSMHVDPLTEFTSLESDALDKKSLYLKVGLVYTGAILWAVVGFVLAVAL